MRKIAALVIALLAASCVGQPAYAGACQTRASVMEQVVAAVPGSVWRELTQPERDAVMRDYNATEPVTDFVASSVGYMSHPSQAEVVFLVITDVSGCVIEAAPVPLRFISRSIGVGV